MKSLVFKELLLLSVQRRQARRIRFHRSATIISGDNATGKSQILKSLYACFGALPAVGSDLFEAASLKLLLTFSVDGRDYLILRDGGSYTLFNAAEKVLGTYRNVVGGLAVELAKLFDFHLEFYTSADEPRAAHPRYLFAPFYIDQDHGWTSPWASFAKLNTSRRSDAIEYHVGIRPNSYYQAKARLRQLQGQAKEPGSERTTLTKILASLRIDEGGVPFNIDFEEYSKEVENLLLASRRLQETEEAFRERIVELENERVQLHLEMEIASKAAEEFHEDFEHAVTAGPERIECPLCGASYENGIAERFGIVRDEIMCEDLRSSLADRVAVLDEKLTSEQARYDSNRRQLSEVNAALEAKRNDVSLREVIHAQGKRDVREGIEADIATLDATIAELDRQMGGARRTMKAASDRKLKERILDFYRARLQSIAVDLQASPLPPEMVRAISPRIPSGSSEFPRRLLAYFVAILHTIRRNTSSTYCPVVVDTVNQQDQSAENLARMYGLLAKGLPSDTQLILGCVNTGGIRFAGDVIRLDEKHGLLKASEYEENAERVRRLFEVRFAYEQSTTETSESGDLT